MNINPLFHQLLDFTTLAAGWQRVRDNHGCAGADGICIHEFEEDLFANLTKLQQEIRHAAYAPYPLLQIQVEKPKGGTRTLSVPTIRDRTAQAAVLQIIEPILEAEFETCSFAYRKGHSVKQAVYQIKEYRERGYKWVVEADIVGFFDNVDHTIMMQKIAGFIPDERLCRLINQWVKAEIYNGEAITPLDKGIPQGGLTWAGFRIKQRLSGIPSLPYGTDCFH